MNGVVLRLLGAKLSCVRTNGVVLRLLGAKFVRTNGVVLRLLGAKLAIQVEGNALFQDSD
jgi:hypothetical protein